ncbi:MAG: NAD(P)H-quinone oxidoreductase [Bacteroidota bacterium]|nr:NAD(P)H-quinone oxidoreductase [Bacteroidota bacterium]MDP4215660.1 NAD(P)H-quinone oxidoreductase [Bacteroidota bacterium]MDP4259774.1 NAD(P)H-quinone oxidoreductase [Bacteroidota bacterium]
MKAIVITSPGAPEVLQLQDRPIPLPGEGEVLVQVRAAGINRPDISQRKGNYPAPPGFSPDIPGLEIAGVVEQCGAAVRRWKPGDKVCALLGGGGYAEYATVPEGQCLPIPRGWSLVEAACLPETVFTVWHNVFQRGRLKEGERFLVHGGSGGIGTTAIQLAKAFGAIVLATAGSEEKCAVCVSLGADRCINYKKEDFSEAFRAEGADLILDMVGGDYIGKNLRLLRPDGRLVFINAPRGSKAEIDAFEIMSRRLTLTGSTLRARDPSFKAALAAEIEKKVWPVLETGRYKPMIFAGFPLGEASRAHALMESGGHTGKIVLEV